MEKPLKILHIEDNEADAGLVVRALKNGGLSFVVKIVETKPEFEEALNEFKPDVILSDHSLPQFDSMEALGIYKAMNRAIPFILITGSVSEEFAVKSIKEGADDYLLKSSLIRLPDAIRHALKTKKAEVEKTKAVQMLVESNKELNTFIYKAAHDLRGPLCSIMGLANIAAIEQEKENLPDYISKISESTKKLDDVLLSLIEAMSIRDSTLVMKEVNLKKMIQAAIDRFKFMKGFDKIHFKTDVRLPDVFYSDKRILNSILQNLIENAIKFQKSSAEASEIIVRVSRDESFIVVEVEDNGSGIETNIQDKVFEMYFRGNQNSKGSGLGLYIVKNAVERLNGAIELTSTLTTGTKVSIRLPLEHENA